MNRRERTALDDPVQRLPLLIVEQWRVARCLTIHQAGWPLGVESQHPVPHRLHPDTADPGGLGAGPAVIDRRQRQQAPGLSGILRPLRQHAYLRRLVIPANSNRSRHGKPPPVCHGESYSPRLGNPLRESRSGGLGISSSNLKALSSEKTKIRRFFQILSKIIINRFHRSNSAHLGRLASRKSNDVAVSWGHHW